MGICFCLPADASRQAYALCGRPIEITCELTARWLAAIQLVQAGEDYEQTLEDVRRLLTVSSLAAQHESRSVNGLGVLLPLVIQKVLPLSSVITTGRPDRWGRRTAIMQRVLTATMQPLLMPMRHHGAR